MRTSSPSPRSAGFTLVELMIVLIILAALAGLLVPLFAQTTEDTAMMTAQATLRRTQQVIVGSAEQPGYLADNRALPRPLPPNGAFGDRQDHPQLAFLFLNPQTQTSMRTFDPQTGLGWRGPYLAMHTGVYALDADRGFTDLYGHADDPAVVDPWGRPLVIQQQADPTDNRFVIWRLVSAGPDRDLLATGDNLSVELNRQQVVFP